MPRSGLRSDLASEKTIDVDNNGRLNMTLRCSKCGSFNVDKLATCGNCGNSLSQADRVVFRMKKKTMYPGESSGTECPYCGQPMEDGVLEISASRGLCLLWSGLAEEKELVSSDLVGYRCTSCKCLLVSYQS